MCIIPSGCRDFPSQVGPEAAGHDERRYAKGCSRDKHAGVSTYVARDSGHYYPATPRVSQPNSSSTNYRYHQQAVLVRRLSQYER